MIDSGVRLFHFYIYRKENGMRRLRKILAVIGMVLRELPLVPCCGRAVHFANYR